MPEQSFDCVLKHYIETHPFKMMAIIEKEDGDLFKVCYANQSLKKYFLCEDKVSVDDFFGDFSSFIKNEMGLFQRNRVHKKQVEWCHHGQDVLLEIHMQRKVTDCQREFFIVELHILQDLLEERQARTEFEHKYTSVIDHNLDPIISINDKLYSESKYFGMESVWVSPKGFRRRFVAKFC